MELESISFFHLSDQADDLYIREATAIVRRTAGKDDVEPVCKRARISQDLAYSQSQSQDASRENDGTLKRIELINFMCHAHFVLNFNPKVNFIIGQNGSGKSAILTAITVGLGAQAKETGRGRTLKDLIKTGETSATVCIDLYKREVRADNGRGEIITMPPGETITIKRQINATSSTVQVRAGGKLISTKMDFVHQLLREMGIQINNPISVLDQNTARTFLSQSSPTAKYELFMRATALEDIEKFHIEIQMLVDMTKTEILKKEKDLTNSRGFAGNLINKYKEVEELQKMRKKKDKLIEELLWAKVNELRRTLHEKGERLKMKQTQLSEAQQAMAVGNEENADDEISRLVELAEDLAKKELKGEEELKKQKRSLRVLEGSIKQESQELASTRNALARANKFISDYNAAIQKEVCLGEPQERAQKLRDDIRSLTERKAEIEKNQELKNIEKFKLASQIKKLDDELTEMRLSKQKFDEKKNNIERQMRSIASDASNTAVYGDWVPALNAQIERAVSRGQFRKCPVGPLGKYIGVRDESWAPAIESVIGGWMTSYVVDNADDLKQLKAILDTVCRGPRKPTVIKTKFFDRVHDTSGGCVRAPPYNTILDLLEISNPVAANLLIDKSMIERILLIPDEKVCQDMFSEKRNVPSNSLFAITKEMNTYYPAPQYRTYAGSGNGHVRFLKASKEAILQSLQRDLAEATHRNEEYESKIKAIQTEMRLLRHTSTEIDRDCSSTNAELAKLSAELNELKNQEEPEESMVAYLRHEVEKKRLELQTFQEKEKAMKKKIKELEQQKKVENGRLEELQAEVNSIYHEKTRIAEAEIEMNEKKMRWKREQANLNAAATKLTEEIGELDRNVSELTEEFRSTKEDAEKFDAFEQREIGSEFNSMRDTRRKEAEVEKELNSTSNKIQALQRNIGGDENDVIRQYKRMQKREAKTKQQLENLKLLAENLQTAMKMRHKVLKSMLKMNQIAIDHTFRRILKARKYKGALDFREGKLEIIIGPSGNRAASTLSGGERSFTTMALLIALWYVTHLPFYFLDEFDVFMDVANRETIMNLMMDYTRKRNYQFCFLTPLNTSTISAAPDVSILRLPPPRASNTTAH